MAEEIFSERGGTDAHVLAGLDWSEAEANSLECHVRESYRVMTRGTSEATTREGNRFSRRTKSLLSPYFDHSPRGTSSKSTNCQSVTSVEPRLR